MILSTVSSGKEMTRSSSGSYQEVSNEILIETIVCFENNEIQWKHLQIHWSPLSHGSLNFNEGDQIVYEKIRTIGNPWRLNKECCYSSRKVAHSLKHIKPWTLKSIVKSMKNNEQKQWKIQRIAFKNNG